jgi:YHS domain-containing protein
MFRKKTIATTLLSLCIVVAGTSLAFSTSGNLVTAHELHEEKAATPAPDVCPVSGEEIGKDTQITYEFKGKTYRFCCPDCAEMFKKDPEKYIDKMKEQDEKKS